MSFAATVYVTGPGLQIPFGQLAGAPRGIRIVPPGCPFEHVTGMSTSAETVSITAGWPLGNAKLYPPATQSPGLMLMFPSMVLSPITQFGGAVVVVVELVVVEVVVGGAVVVELVVVDVVDEVVVVEVVVLEVVELVVVDDVVDVVVVDVVDVVVDVVDVVGRVVVVVEVVVVDVVVGLVFSKVAV